MTRGSSKRRKQERQQEREQQRQRRQQGSSWSDDDEDSGGDAWAGESNDAHAGASGPNQDVRRNGLHDWQFVTLCACMLVFCRLYRCCSR